MGWAMRRFLRSIMVVFSWVVVPYSRIANITTSRKKLPAIENELLKISATKLAKLIRNQQVSTFIILKYKSHYKRQKNNIRLSPMCRNHKVNLLLFFFGIYNMLSSICIYL